MQPFYRVTSAVLGLVFFLTTCSVDDLKDPIIVPLIDQEFHLDLWQTLGESTLSNLEVRMTTIEDEECLNTRILSTYERTGRVTAITLYDILDPETCDPGSAPARGEERLTDLEPETYGIKIELRDVVSNDGTLHVTEDGYFIEMTESTGFTWLNKTIYRVPDNLLWGYVAFANAAEEARVADFVADLRAQGVPAELTEGYYGYFTVSNGGNTVKIADAPSADSAKIIFLDYTGGNALIDQKIAAFLSETGNENIELRLLNSRGDEWIN